MEAPHLGLTLTLDVYGWVLPAMQADAAAVFSRLVSAVKAVKADPVEEQGSGVRRVSPNPTDFGP